MTTLLKVERQVFHDQVYFEQFDNLTLAAMAFNLTDEGYDLWTHARDQRLDDDTAWNLSASIANSNMALRVLVVRLSSSAAEALSAGIYPLPGETLQ
ncbi:MULTISPECIES: hypothetical protein [Pseudomonas]|uniref:hypothetical protein n=1 Tax=Pseudomonas TaxID=286 RepID=UPI000F76C88D|nr:MULTISPECIES: hypothetical protein [Pseudomonas]MBA1217246.1 hypothetical protein [Pseudomonas fulva]MCP3791261.1 hypothetical protein [Pseudomonas sp. N2-11]MDH0571018.1 hypothetical protein [Pseudomonas fulva]RRW63218.1 hypothetical protein EGJ51_07520 [Pseudomonas fulva]